MDRVSSDRHEAVRLATLRRLGILDSPREAEFDRIVMIGLHMFRVPACAIALVDEHRLWFKSIIGFEMPDIHRTIAFCSETILDDDVLVVADARSDPRFQTSPLVIGPPLIRFYAGAPLIARDGSRVGAVCAVDRRVRHFSDVARHQLQAMARETMQLMEARAPASGRLQGQ